MNLLKLRLLGFKSFVEPTDVLVEPGLTGVVGPNGCGKSNLVEALRWVMGESSHKNLRAAEMDDVIFAGSGNRPARNTAEVILTIDNSDRSAPALFNDTDILEISRRIERDKGSAYRVNGREVRARDVQLIFADASTGARSPALVRQGQIAELIAAKPQARRRILEEAAGISGLHTRRHEAELRLKAAEHNLDRLDDVIRQIESQLDGLKKQSRQATRYKALSGDIHRAEALLFHLTYLAAGREVGEGAALLEVGLRDVAEKTRAQSEAVRLAAIAAHDLPPLRESEKSAAALVQKLGLARNALHGEERRATERRIELDNRIAQFDADIAREKTLIDDAAAALGRLADEDAALHQEDKQSSGLAAASKQTASEAELALSTSEQAMGKAQGDLAELSANRGAAERAFRDSVERSAKLDQQVTELDRERKETKAKASDATLVEGLRAALSSAHQAATAAEAAMLTAEARHVQARDQEAGSRGPLEEAERLASRLDTEASTLAKLVLAPTGAKYPPVLDQIQVSKGYEAALGAAFGEDLDATLDHEAPVRWAGIEALPTDPALPVGVRPLTEVVKAPSELKRRLQHIGLVDAEDGPRLAPSLLSGQCLVSKRGDLWRWDGFVAASEAPSAAARRLAERNRLADLQDEAQAAKTAVVPFRQAALAAQAALAEAVEAERSTRERWRTCTKDLDVARDALAQAEQRSAQMKNRLSALDEAYAQLSALRLETIAARQAAETALAGLPDGHALTTTLSTLQVEVAERRVILAEARAALASLAREAEMRAKRLITLANERGLWAERQGGGAKQIETLSARLVELKAEREALDEAPAVFAAKRRALMVDSDEAEAKRTQAASALAEAEARLAAADRLSREMATALSETREQHARSEEKLSAAKVRLKALADDIETTLGVSPQDALKAAGHTLDDRLPDPTVVKRNLDNAKAERERLGAVNLRADDELSEIQTQYDTLVRERDDLVEAIKRLRTAIASLNREGRERLLAAFETVNGHFQRLFETLFGGGTAELTLTESDDPLEAGLDILARPPGKKPQTLSLLSGGEQALTAMALIFAVFLTNPAPICVLDEVDAPLDDANVERFCDLLDEMVRQTETRFVTITHNPITMARMNRLFGVTMAERGVSQLVSVDLGEAERIREAV